MYFSVSLFAVIISSFLAINAHDTETAIKVFYSLDSAESLFQQFIIDHQKQYTNDEAQNRFQIFKENLKRMNELNQMHESTVFGITKFSDLTSKEFMQSISCFHGNFSDVQPLTVPDITVPEELDYRKQQLVTEIKNQQHCGSCYVFATMADIEGQQAKLHKQLISLSEQYPLDCGDYINCEGGWPKYVTDWLATTPGPIKTSDYPYVGYVQESCGADPKKAVVKVKGCKQGKVANSEELKKVVAAHGPLVICIVSSPDLHHYKGGIFAGHDCGIRLNHAVAIVGYGKEKEENYWIMKNSWGSSWGENGFFRIAMDRCKVGSYLAPTEIY